MNKKNAIVIADSISNGNRITSYLLTVPQIIVKELLRHRMFSFSSSSMRAIPFNKVLEDIRENMFVPLAFQSHHSGMQGREYLMGEESEKAKQQWIESGLRACEEAERLYNLGVTKQLCSRIIEPFGYAKILVTATEWENFFELRCPAFDYLNVATYKSRKDAIKETKATLAYDDWYKWQQMNQSQAEIHIQALAEAMWDEYNQSKPKQLESGQWHIPFGDNIDVEKLKELENKYQTKDRTRLAIKVCVARCARLSYATHDGKIDYEKDITLHDQLLESRHASPFEHCCRVLTEEEYNILGKMVLHPENGYVFENGWVDNFKGFISYRRILNI